MSVRFFLMKNLFIGSIYRTEMGKSCTPAYKIFLYALRSVQLVRAMENVTYGSFGHTKIVLLVNSWSVVQKVPYNLLLKNSKFYLRNNTKIKRQSFQKRFIFS